jgi:hypothetical protein
LRFRFGVPALHGQCLPDPLKRGVGIRVVGSQDPKLDREDLAELGLCRSGLTLGCVNACEMVADVRGVAMLVPEDAELNGNYLTEPGLCLGVPTGNLQHPRPPSSRDWIDCASPRASNSSNVASSHWKLSQDPAITLARPTHGDGIRIFLLPCRGKCGCGVYNCSD